MKAPPSMGGAPVRTGDTLACLEFRTTERRSSWNITEGPTQSLITGSGEQSCKLQYLCMSSSCSAFKKLVSFYLVALKHILSRRGKRDCNGKVMPGVSLCFAERKSGLPFNKLDLWSQIWAPKGKVFTSSLAVRHSVVLSIDNTFMLGTKGVICDHSSVNM